MADNGVTHKELNKALGAQTARIIATINRSEDVAREDLKEVSDRVTYIERRNRFHPDVLWYYNIRKIHRR
jgi:hypothetical protein